MRDERPAPRDVEYHRIRKDRQSNVFLHNSPAPLEVVVVTGHEVDRKVFLHHLSELRKDTDVLARNDGAVRNAELEKVTVDEQPG